ncbi:MAG: AMP-binding protein [Candidatus Eremiobacteraeota bacterium]|nr:AMP-binding protein [Candidatus Eremiobacteraeota bacterium]
MAVSGHIDRFAQEHLPAPQDMPEFRFDLPTLHYRDQINAAEYFVDRHVSSGHGTRRAILAPDGTAWTYADLYAASNKIANVLVEDFGIVPGARVLLRSPNTPMLAACWFAVLKAGAIAVTTMPLYRSTELRHICEKARVSLALCDARLGGEMQAALDQGTPVNVAYFQTDASDGIETRMQTKAAQFSNVGTAAEDVAIIGFTSGTTGTPKAAMHFHRDLLAICDTYGSLVLQPLADDVFCGSPPIAFTFGLGGLLLFPLYKGAATLLLEKAGPEDLLRNIEACGVTTLFTAPLAYRAMTAIASSYDLRSLRTCVSAGETLPRPVFTGWQEQTGLAILDGIGSTEMLHIFLGSTQERVRAGSTGEVVPGYVAEIHDDEGRPLPDGEIGRLAVKGPTGCKYLADERQRSYVHNGWNYPGDAYRRDADGYFYYVARTDDMIVSAGFNVSGPEVEQAMLAHDHVKECAVVAKPDLLHETHIVKAYVVLIDGIDACDEKDLELREHCKALIAPFKAPREIEFVAALPRTETGKVQRYKLRQRASAE